MRAGRHTRRQITAIKNESTYRAHSTLALAQLDNRPPARGADAPARARGAIRGWRRRAATRRAAYRADPRTDRSPACARARSLGGALGVGESAPGRVRAALAAVTRQRRARARDFRCAAAPSHPAPRFVLISIARRRKPRSRAGSRARASSEGGGHVGSTLTFSLSSLAARAPPRAQVHNAAATGRAGFNPRAWRGVRGFVPRLEPRGDQNQHHEGAIVDKRPK